MILALSEEYDRTYFLGAKDISMVKGMLLRIVSMFYIPKFLIGSFLARADKNPIARKKIGKRLSGELNVSSAVKLIKLEDLKFMTRKLNITINDIVMGSLSTSLKSLFLELGDTSKEYNLVIPANIRFKFYPTRKQIILENKFAGIPLNVPLTTSMQDSYTKIKKVTH